MKSTLLLSALLALTACGPRKKVITQLENNYDDSQTQSRLQDLEHRVSVLESTVSLNVSIINNNSSNIAILQSQLSSEISFLLEQISLTNNAILELQSQSANQGLVSEAQEQELAALRQELDNTKAALNQAITEGGQAYSSIVNSINSLSNSNGTLQNSVNTLLSQMAQLQTNQHVVAVVDPCPTVTSTDYKEMLLKLGDGKLVAYFEDGGKRFLSVLKPGSYQTTDRRACSFIVTNNNTIQ